MTKKNLKIAIAIILLSLLWCFAPLFIASCEAAEITEQEITILETNLTKLETLNNQSQQELVTLKAQLTESQEALAKAKQQSETLAQQLQDLKNNSDYQEKLLQSVNESLKEYEQEMKAKQNRLEMQRNIAYTIIAFFILKEVN